MPHNYIFLAMSVLCAIGPFPHTLSIDLPATFEVPISLPPSEYIGKVNDQLMVNISAFVTVKETDFNFVGKETFLFRSTGLKIVVGDGSGASMKVGAVETVKVTYTNPLKVPLTDAEFTAEGTALMDPLDIPV